MKHDLHERRSDLTVGALDSWSRGLGPKPWLRHCVVFLGKILQPHSASGVGVVGVDREGVASHTSLHVTKLG